MVESKQPGSGQPTTSSNTGRPTLYTPELAAELCSYLSEAESLRTACNHEGMPDKSQVFRWLSLSNTAEWAQDFRDQYTRAKEESADAMAEEILYISDNTEEGETIVEKLDKDGNAYTETRTGDMLGHRKLQIDTRKFLMAKMKPKRYGDKLDLTSGGEKLERGTSLEEINAILARAAAEEAERNKSQTVS